MSFADLLTGNRFIRWAADNALARYSRKRTLYLDAANAPALQERMLLKLVNKARNTRFGKEHDFASIQSIADYQQRVPVRDYEAFWNQYWQPRFPKVENSTWPGRVPYFALSSGTTSGATKFIPISKEMLKSNRKAAFTTLAFYRHLFPNERLFNGRVFFLGGNTQMRQESDGSRSGDLSAIAAVEVSSLLRPYAFPPLALSGIGDWDTKLQLLAEQSAKLPITVFSGVPSWQLRLFDKLKSITGKKTIAEIWPTLRVVVHGGTSFDPYREVFRREIGSDKVRFLEVYPCSEGFVATEDPRYNLLRIVPDHGILFEFVPMSEFDESHGKLKSDRPIRHTLANVETGVQYAVLVTSCAGLWSYLVGDTIAFEQRNPPLIRFTGRTKFFLSAFGEHLISEEIEKAIMRASTENDAEAQDHHVGPLFPSEPKRPGRHLYLIEFRKRPSDLERFARIVDEELSRLNEDYQAHRQGDLTMLEPIVTVVKPGGFEGWLRSRPNFSPQHKVPRMDNTGKVTTAIQTWLHEHGFVE
jgi:GH3 auxin-responsive promoter